MTGIEHKALFTEWMRQHKGIIFKVIRAYCSRLQDQEDLFQEITLQVWNSIPKFEGHSKPSTWIYRISFYCASNWVRHQKNNLKRQELFEENRHLLRPSEVSENPRIKWLYKRIQQFPEPDRMIILLYLDRQSHQQVSEIIGLKTNNIAVRINRIKKRLNQLSIEEGNDEF